MKNKTTFESFLQQYWMDEEAEGQTKDQCEDACDTWMEQLDVAELIELGELYGSQTFIEGFDTATEVMRKSVEQIKTNHTK